MNLDLRCRGKKHAILIEPGLIEVKCNSRLCGAGSDIIVLHRFDALTGELVDTKRFRSPESAKAKAQKGARSYDFTSNS